MIKRPDNKCLMLVLFFALLFSLDSGLFFFVGLIFFSYYLLRRKVCNKDSGFILKFFVYSLAVRILLLILLSNASIFIGKFGWINRDSWAVQKYAWQYDQFLSAQNDYLLEFDDLTDIFEIDYYTPNINENYEGYGIHSGVLYLVPFVHYVGVSKYSLRIINMLMSVFSGILIYYIIKRVSDENVAKIGALLFTFQPSLVFWSILYLKDSVVIFLLTLFFYLSQRISIDKKYKYFPIILVILFLLKCLFLVPLDNIVFTVGILSIVFVSLSRRKIYAVLFMVSLLFLTNYDYISLQVLKIFNSTLSFKNGFLAAGGINYDNLPSSIVRFQDLSNFEFNSSLERFLYILSSFFHYFFEPLPSNWMKSLSMATYVPQLFYWYLLTPFAVLGMLLSFTRNYFRGIFVIFVLFLVIFLSYALSSANIGTIVRHRDMLSPMMIIFFSIGLRPFLNFKRPLTR